MIRAPALPPLLLQLACQAAAQSCSSPECLAGACVDATPGAAELGTLASCTEAAVAAAQDCSVPMDALDASLSPSVSLGSVCARTCGWCTNPDEFQEIQSLRRNFCIAHEPPTCVPTPGSGVTGCQSDDGSFSTTHPVHGKEACEAVPGCKYTPGANQPAATDCVVHPASLTAGEIAWLFEHDSARTASVLRTQGLNGDAIACVSKEELVDAGLTLSEARWFIDTRDGFFKQMMPGLREHAAQTSDQAAAWGFTSSLDWVNMAASVPPAAPVRVDATAIIENVFAVSEMDYTFEVAIKLVLSWHDPAIFRECNGVKPWDDDESLECPEIWRPEIVFVNAVEVEIDEERSELFALP